MLCMEGGLTIRVGLRQPTTPMSNWLPAPEAPPCLAPRLLEGRHNLPPRWSG